jgi:hypothetical protein
MANPDAAYVTLRFLPILDWIPGYRRDRLLPDLVVGLALWAVMVPVGPARCGAATGSVFSIRILKETQCLVFAVS